ncbi:tRNA (34-2'-O)-methyltransferase regulator WDR6-like isoform X1 [Saccostrea echinata]|uniref:tRNA (34-2'-O)-methyltransferase regulator WDR6-like isoform X1 n=1 Tax=Saccostrea echinata TaxID=191078 RepID=UPI002A82DE20|nr:tRNA (34-2'-O)-methyltransferase regulator WDR6-like isoform X1 [Saccostrea echinata]
MEHISAIRCDFMTGPVTALHIITDNFVLAGIGSYLHTFDISLQRSISCDLVLPCRCIHGIRAFKGKTELPTLAVFGEKSITMIDLHLPAKKTQSSAVDDETANNAFSVTSKAGLTEFEDWIWDALSLDKENSDNLALALGHNTVIRWDWKQRLIVEKVTCVENCILYCAKFINSNWEHLILAAGTVFNEILLWAPKGQKSESGHVTVLKSLKGHKGVIFSVEYIHQKQMMCSASDDRSIRLWQFKFENSSAPGEVETPLELWENSSCSCVGVLYGHSARVWDVRLLSSTLVSVGEDSTCCVWNYKGDILQKFKGHKGKSIWSLTVDDKERFVVTGGGDASIRLWFLSSRSERSNYRTHSLQLPHMLSGGKEDDYPRSVGLLNHNEIIVITNEGYLYLYHVEEERWQTLQDDSEFRSYTVMSVAPTKHKCVALGNIHGTLRIFTCRDASRKSDWSYKDWKICDGKIMSVHWLSGTQLLTTGLDGEIKLWNFEVVSMILECCGQYTLPMCKQRWVSAATVGHGSLICGDRGGTIHLFQLGSEWKSPSQSFPKIHGKTGVSSICFYGDNVYTTGRDGCYRVFSHDVGHLTLLNSYRVYKGFEWIDRLQIEEEGAEFFVFGFQSSDFVLWSVNSNQKLIQIPCGGGHRSWDCKTKGDNFRFVYQKTREVVVCDTKLQQNQVKLKSALHGREVTCVRFFDVREDGCIIVTGSEDTSVQISTLKYNNYSVKEISCIEYLNEHISSVRALSLCPSSKQSHDQKSMLMFSAGGRAQLLVWRLTVENSTSLVTENLCSFMIGQIKRKGRTRMWKLQQINLNPETRFMDLSSVQLTRVWSEFPDHLHILASACSDAFVRFYIFNEEKRELFLLLESVFHEHCVLKVCPLTRKSKTDSELYILSAATDGQIAFWKINKGNISLIVKKQLEPSPEKVNMEKTFSSIENDTGNQISDNLREQCDTAKSVMSTSKTCNSEDEQRVSSDLQYSQYSDYSSGNSYDAGHIQEDSKGSLETDSVEKEDMEKMRPVFVLRHHQSGVNGMDWLHYKDDDFLIATGGDDNALFISLVQFDDDFIRAKAKGFCLCAHATEITGVKFLSPSKLLSVSIDQRLILWDIRITNDDIQVQQLSCKFVCVADISNIDVWKVDKNRFTVVVSGQGLATFDVQCA